MELVDPGWLLDNVLVVAEPGLTRIGNARSRQGAWFGAVAELERASADDAGCEAVHLATTQGLVLDHDQARACGLDRATVRRLLRSRRWSAPRRGVLSPLPSDPLPSDSPLEVRRLSPHGLGAPVRAAAAALARPGTIVSHESALAAHGLPVLASIVRPVLTAPDIARTATKPDALVRDGFVSKADLDDWFGCPVTGVERSIVDVGRTAGVGAALAAADAALNDHLTTRARLRAARERAHHRPGVLSAERAIELASPLAESPLESLTRLCLIDGGLPAPDLQVPVPTSRGVYRVDALYRDARVIVESDGEEKYFGRPRALLLEKRRQEALERAGFIVVRVSWSDVMNEPREVVRRVREAMRRRR